MQTKLSDQLLSTTQGREADAILRRCVHCGFCNATCPTYQIKNDELDGPRGRIYLIKQLLEGQADTGIAREHLDRCLTCRSCETTCPSGVEYSRLLDIGRAEVERGAPRPWSQRLLRWMLLRVVPFPARFAPAAGMGRWVAGLLPAHLRKAIPPAAKAAGQWPAARHARRVILLDGCVQSVAAPQINLATARVLDSLGISAIRLFGEGCCGALNQHLNATDSAAAMMRRNIDAWWPHFDNNAKKHSGERVEAIISTASACGLQVKDYAHYLQFDKACAQKAKIISARVKDVSELIAAEPVENIVTAGSARVAFHAPCTLQHGQRLGGVVEQILGRCGFELSAVKDGHLCCGSAGTYSIFQPQLSAQLQANKLAALQAGRPTVIASANIGCLLHLREGSAVPVKHWVELLADCLQDQ
jgi:glycolate dehydrogenase iron-sulfur subunit